MSSKPSGAQPYSAAVLTVSDSAARGKREDLSGPAVVSALEKAAFRVVATSVVADQIIPIENAIIRLAAKANLVVTTGGTGVAARDVTPEATRSVCDRLVEGVAERMRAESMKKTPFAALSRALCGIRGATVVLNLPGSPAGATECLAAVIDVLPHAIDLLRGKTAHAAPSSE